MSPIEIFVMILVVVGIGLFAYFMLSGKFGGGVIDAVGNIFQTGAAATQTVTKAVGIVAGNQQLGEACEKDKLACGAGLVCDAGKCVHGTAKIGERCTPGKTSGSVWKYTIAGGIAGAWSKKGGIECESGAHCVNNICYKDPGKKGDKCYPDKLKCPSGLSCWPRSGWGTCHNNPAGYGEFCMAAGGHKIKCGSGLKCYPRTSAGGKCQRE